MKATDFDLSQDLKFDMSKGITSFKDTRLVLLDANALGLLRSKIVEVVGKDKAREIYLQFGYQQGFSDFLQMQLNYDFGTEMDLLASGPVIHTWEGIVKAVPSEIRFNRDENKMYFTGVWENSYEAEQFLQYNDVATEPQCWTLTGYASGWITAFFSKPVLAFETHCKAKGDFNCGWLAQTPEQFGEEAKPYIDALNIFWKEVQ